MRTNRLRLIIYLLLTLSGIFFLLTACDELITENTTVNLTGYPVAKFTVSADTCCRPCSLEFRDNSDGPRHTFLWYFGDGDSSTERDPVHYYTDTGFFDVELIIRDTISGNEDNDIKQRFVHILDTIPKIPQFSFFTMTQSVSNPLQFTFADSTKGTIKTWRWDFGDSTALGVAKSVNHTYTDTGTYAIRLTIENSCDSTDLFDTLVVDSL
jgi:PKD repeat protein